MKAAVVLENASGNIPIGCEIFKPDIGILFILKEGMVALFILTPSPDIDIEKDQLSYRFFKCLRFYDAAFFPTIRLWRKNKIICSAIRPISSTSHHDRISIEMSELGTVRSCAFIFYPKRNKAAGKAIL